MIRFIMTFKVPAKELPKAEKIIRTYFDELEKYGPGGMRSQCYEENSGIGSFVHIKGFRKESVANQHFRSPVFKDYINHLAAICGVIPGFYRLQQQESFESIY